MTLLERVKELIALATQVFGGLKTELADAKAKIAELEAAFYSSTCSASSNSA